MSTIWNIRGTSGSGKSTLVRAVMERVGVECTLCDKRSTPYIRGYSLKTWYDDERPLWVIGDYTNVCGGADTVGSFAKIKEMVALYAGHGDTLFEGLLWSTVYKSSDEFAQTMEAAGHHMVFAVLGNCRG